MQNIVKKHNIKYNSVDFECVTSLGNGDFAYNCDITGFQTLYNEYLEHNNPLATMSNFDFANYDDAVWKLKDLTFDEYETNDIRHKWVKYPANEVPLRHFQDGHSESILTNPGDIEHNKQIYNSLRQNPHRVNIGTLQLEINGRVPSSSDISEIEAEFDLLSGIFASSYVIDNYKFEVHVVCLGSDSSNLDKNKIDNKNTPYKVRFNVRSQAFLDGNANIKLYKSPASHTISGCDFAKRELIAKFPPNEVRNTDEFDFIVNFKNGEFENVVKTFENVEDEANQSVRSVQSVQSVQSANFDNTNFRVESNAYIVDFWKRVKIIPLDDSRAEMLELERREVLSLYNLAIHSSGSLPPQETGLMCNSWYGKFHLEMHYWHASWAPLYNVSDLLEKSIDWYLKNVDTARENAEINGYKGLRWPKMVGPNAATSPSFIAPLLIWQQSHIIYMLYLLYKYNNFKLPFEYFTLIEGTVDFMCDFLVYDETLDKYILQGPLIPAQEEFDPLSVKNPTFELSYWKYCLKLACEMLDNKTTEILDNAKVERIRKINDIIAKFAIPKPVNGLFPSHENAPDTFPKFMKDHPMQLAIHGLFNNVDMLDAESQSALLKTLHEVLQNWDEQSMWGWDYGYMAMLAHSLGDSELAIKILLKKCPKNYYCANGHNYQLGRTDLPSYLPGNGALLLAIHKIFG